MGWRSERSTYLVAAAWITISGRTSLKTSRIDSMFVTSIGSVRQPVNCCASILNLLFRPVSTTWLSLDSRIPKRLPRKPVPPVISIMCFISEPFCESVEPEIRAPVGGFYECRLISLIQHARLQDQEIHLCSHETTVTIFRGAYDGLTTHIETGVYDQRAAGLPAKRIDDFPVKWISFTPYGLNVRRIIDVRNHRNVGPPHVEFFYSPQFLLFCRHLTCSGSQPNKRLTKPIGVTTPKKQTPE